MLEVVIVIPWCTPDAFTFNHVQAILLQSSLNPIKPTMSFHMFHRSPWRWEGDSLWRSWSTRKDHNITTHHHHHVSPDVIHICSICCNWCLKKIRKPNIKIRENDNSMEVFFERNLRKNFYFIVCMPLACYCVPNFRPLWFLVRSASQTHTNRWKEK